MGGIQAREGSLAEVHAVRGGQLILRVASSQTSGSGSGGGATKSASTPRLNLIIPYDGRCYLLEQSMDVLEKIFFRLTPRELALLSLTCRTMHLIVSQFLEHYCASYGLGRKLKAFYEVNADLLLPKEWVLKDRLECNSRHQLLLYSAMRQFVGNVKRVSACDVEEFDHLGTSSDCQIIKERDVALKRDVVVVKKVACLRFSHTFRHVTPGRYTLQIRLRLSNARWEKIHPQCPAVVTVTSKVAGKSEKMCVEQKIDPHWWGTIECHQSHSEFENASVVFDRDSDWFFLKLRSFSIVEEAEVKVTFDDSANPNWKHGAIFDFVELKSVVKMLRE